MVLFKIASETSAETDVNCLDSQTLFASVEFWECVCLHMWSFLWVSGTTWSSEAVFITSALGSLLMSVIWRIFFFFQLWQDNVERMEFSLAACKSWRLILSSSVLSLHPGWKVMKMMWVAVSLKLGWYLYTCISNCLLIGPVFSGSSASLALGRGGNEPVAAQCRAGDNNEDCSGRMGGTFCLPQLVWYMSYTIIWPKGFLSVWKREIKPFEIELLAFRQVYICASLAFLNRKHTK